MIGAWGAVTARIAWQSNKGLRRSKLGRLFLIAYGWFSALFATSCAALFIAVATGAAV